jgi:hypothetical protein
MQDSYPVSWKELFFQALLESDDAKLTELVQAAEHAMVIRAQELLDSTDHHEERSEMAIAKASWLACRSNARRCN